MAKPRRAAQLAVASIALVLAAPIAVVGAIVHDRLSTYAGTCRKYTVDALEYPCGRIEYLAINPGGVLLDVALGALAIALALVGSAWIGALSATPRSTWKRAVALTIASIAFVVAVPIAVDAAFFLHHLTSYAGTCGPDAPDISAYVCTWDEYVAGMERTRLLRIERSCGVRGAAARVDLLGSRCQPRGDGRTGPSSSHPFGAHRA